MNYTPIKKEDFDKSFKFENRSFLCYSGKKIKEIYPNKDYKVVGLARNSKKDTESILLLGDKLMAVFDTEKDNLLYKTIGFVPVNEEDQYIAVQESRAGFLISLGGMAAVTTATCIMILGGIKPTIQPDTEPVPQFNPLPPVDTNIEDYADNVTSSKSEKKEAPKGGGKVTLSYKPNADVKLSTGEVTMEYQNPESSSHDAIISLYVVSGGEEYLVADSGRIPAGKQLKTMQLKADKKLFGSEGKYDAEYHVAYYDPTTGERALTEATIDDITLTVRNG